MVTPNNCESDAVHHMRCLPLFRTCWIFGEKLTLSTTDREQLAGICSRSIVLENVVNNGETHKDELSRLCAVALTIRWVSCLCLHFFAGSKRNGWKSILEKHGRAGALASENGWRLIREMERRVGKPAARKTKKKPCTLSSVQARVLQGASILCFPANTPGLPSTAF